MTITKLAKAVSRRRNEIAVSCFRAQQYNKESQKASDHVTQLYFKLRHEKAELRETLFDLMLRTPCWKFARIVQRKDLTEALME